jgi:hypothetical protein
MRRTSLAIMSAVLIFASAAAHGETQRTPRFTLAEESIIARNDMLSALLAVDPVGVRKIVDAIVASKQRSSSPKRKRGRTVDKPPSGDGAVVIDPARNPDLIVFQRASPEAAYDLFQLLKQVAGGSSGGR